MKIKVKTWEEMLEMKGISLDEDGDLMKEVEDEGVFCKGRMKEDLCGRVIAVKVDPSTWFDYTALNCHMPWGIPHFAVKEVLED